MGQSLLYHGPWTERRWSEMHPASSAAEIGGRRCELKRNFGGKKFWRTQWRTTCGGKKFRRESMPRGRKYLPGVESINRILSRHYLSKIQSIGVVNRKGKDKKKRERTMSRMAAAVVGIVYHNHNHNRQQYYSSTIA